MATEADVQARVRARLRQLRFERGLTLEQVATRAGMVRSTLSRLESGARGMTLAHLPRLADGLGVRVDELLLDAGDAAPPAPARDGKVWHPVLDGRDDGLRAYRIAFPASLREPVLGSHEGFVWFLVVTGRLRVVTQTRDLVLEPGDTTDFPTWMPHWVGPVDEPAEALAVFSPAGRPLRRIEVTP